MKNTIHLISLLVLSFLAVGCGKGLVNISTDPPNPPMIPTDTLIKGYDSAEITVKGNWVSFNLVIDNQDSRKLCVGDVLISGEGKTCDFNSVTLTKSPYFIEVSGKQKKTSEGLFYCGGMGTGAGVSTTTTTTTLSGTIKVSGYFVKTDGSCAKEARKPDEKFEAMSTFSSK